MQMQIQALLTAQGGARTGGEATGSNMGSHMEVAKPAIFNREAGKVGSFITACRLFLRMKLRGATVKEQVQWVLSYMQGGSADVWKENVIEELESGEIEYESAEEFLTSLKKKFGGGEEKSMKVVELRKLEQGGRTMEEFMEEFKWAARGSGYEGRPLIEEFKQGMNGEIRRKLMEAENPLASIEQWYRRAMALDRNWRESRREEERMRGKKEAGSRRRSSKTGVKTKLVTTLSVAKEANALAGNNRACSNRRCGEDKCSGSERAGGRAKYEGSSETGPLCHGGRSGLKLLCMWRIWAHGPQLQESGTKGKSGENRRVEYGGRRIEEIPNFVNNLKKEENLELLN